MKFIRAFVVLCVATLGAWGVAGARSGDAPASTYAGWPWRSPAAQQYTHPYPYPYANPYGHLNPPYGAYPPWGPCPPGFCIDEIQLRRAIRRELQQQELRRELEAREAVGSPGTAGPRYGVARDPPPPTPESQLQPPYRGSGEVRPEYRDSGRVR